MSTADLNKPARSRVVPLLVRHDLVYQEMTFQDIPYVVVKDPLALKYHRLQPEEHRLLSMLDGTRSLEEIRDELQDRYPSISWSHRQVQHLLTDLHQKGLVRSVRGYQDQTALRKKREERWKSVTKVAKNFMYLRLPGWDPEATLQVIYPWLKWMFSPWFLTLAMCAWLWSVGLIFVEWDYFYRTLPDFYQFFAWPNLLYLYMTLAVAKIIHEFGHGLSCIHYGGECHEMGVMLLVFSPCLYCDVSDSWMLPNKWQRIIIGGAGMIIEVIISAGALFLWWNTQPGLFHYLCFNIWVVTSVSTVIFNLNPLMRFDGYYMLSDLLEIPNLRQNADKLFQRSFSKYGLGVDPPPDPLMPTRGKKWFITYAICAWLYRWVILFSITWFLYSVLKPYGLQFIGLFLGLAAIFGMLATFVRSIYRIYSAPRLEPVKKSRPIIAGLSAIALIAILMTLPIPAYVSCEFLVQSHEGEPVYVKTAGELMRVHVTPGQQVAEGELLAELDNWEYVDRLREIDIELEVANKQLKQAELRNDPLQFHTAEERVESLTSEQQDLKERVADLKLYAPADGYVVAAPEQPADPRRDQNRLPTWSGNPLDPENRGAFLEARTHLLTVAPDPRGQAILLIDQRDRNDLRTGEEIELRLEGASGVNYTGEIEFISLQPTDQPPTALSNKAGGESATRTTQTGEEELMAPSYQATVLLDGPTHLLRPGFRGQSQLRIGTRSPAERFRRWLNYTLAFRL